MGKCVYVFMNLHSGHFHRDCRRNIRCSFLLGLLGAAGKVEVVPVDAMNAFWENRVMAPLVLKLGTIWR